MTIPVSSTNASVFITGVSFVGIASGLDASCTIGAFSGAIVFVISAVDFSVFQRWLLFFVSFSIGIVASNFTASLLSTLLPRGFIVEQSIGALISSASSVRVLMLFAAKSKDQSSLLDRFQGRRK